MCIVHQTSVEMIITFSGLKPSPKLAGIINTGYEAGHKPMLNCMKESHCLLSSCFSFIVHVLENDDAVFCPCKAFTCKAFMIICL